MLRLLLASLFINICTYSSYAQSLPIDCESLESLLTSKLWYNAESGNNHSFTRTGQMKGIRKLTGGYTANYTLEKRFLRIRDTPKEQWEKEICTLAFTYLDGDCVGEATTFVVEKLGEGLRFKVHYTDGDRVWDFSDQSYSPVCGLGTYMIIPR